MTSLIYDLPDELLAECIREMRRLLLETGPQDRPDLRRRLLDCETEAHRRGLRAS